MKKAGWIAAAFAGVAIAGAGFTAGANKDAILKEALARNETLTATVALRLLGADPNAREGFLMGEAIFRHNAPIVKEFIAAGYDLNNRGACSVLDSALVVDHGIADILLDAGFKPNTPNCNVLPRIADGWYARERHIWGSEMLKKVLQKGQFTQQQLDDAMAGAATFNPDTTALTALKEAGASADKALQINARNYNSPEAILTLINEAGADPKADGGKAVTEAETTLAEMRARQAKDPSLQFPTDERRRLQMIQILKTPSRG